METCRALLLAEALDSGAADLDRLAASGRDDLRERYDTAAARWWRLATAPPLAGEGVRGGRLADKVREARAEVDVVVGEIRSLAGFGDFLATPTLADIFEAAGDDPLVFLIATPAGGAALMVGAGGREVEAVWLPDLTEEHLAERVALFGDAHRKRGTDAAARQAWLDALGSVTAWLWEAAVGPLLEALSTPPRLLLVPTGLLGLLPLHAASPVGGATGAAAPRGAIDTTTIAWAPSARALVTARRAAARGTAGGGLVAVDEPAVLRPELGLRSREWR